MQSAARLVRRLVYLAILAWLVVCTGMYLMQRKLLYFPQPRHVNTPLMAMPSPAGEILVSVKEQPGPDALIYFGGNAEDVSFAFEELARNFPRHALYLLHYRGYGGSAGEPSEGALVADALKLFDTVRARHENVALIGRSLGSGVAVQVAASRPIARLVLVTSFDSATGVAARIYPWLPVHWLLKDRFDSAAHAARVRSPVLVLAAGLDNVVPEENTRRLIDSFAPAQVVHQVFPGASHDGIGAEDGYSEALRRFLLPVNGQSRKG